MSDNYVGNVLAILRLLKREGTGHSAVQHMRAWCGSMESNPPESQVLRLCAYVTDQAQGAEAVIAGSSLTQEAKDGLLQTITGLRSAFRLEHLNQTAIGAHLPHLEASISSFAILTSATGISTPAPPADLLDALIADIEAVASKLDGEGLDPIVRDTARRHLAALLVLLKNVEAFGVDAAMAAYLELVLRLRRASANASADTQTKVKDVWPTVEKWLGRLTVIDQAVNTSQKLLARLDGLPAVLTGAVKLLGG